MSLSWFSEVLGCLKNRHFSTFLIYGDLSLFTQNGVKMVYKLCIECIKCKKQMWRNTNRAGWHCRFDSAGQQAGKNKGRETRT